MTPEQEAEIRERVRKLRKTFNLGCYQPREAEFLELILPNLEALLTAYDEQAREIARLRERCDKYSEQVMLTCRRAEKAEAVLERQELTDLCIRAQQDDGLSEKQTERKNWLEWKFKEQTPNDR